MKLNDIDSLVKFVEEIAGLSADGDSVEGDDGEHVMENDDAWALLTGLIHDARALLA